MIRAGLDLELDSQKVGVETINFLSKAYEKSIDLKIAAAEYGLAAEAFAKGLADAGGEAGQIKRRLEQGVLPREILEAEFKDLIVKVSDNEPIDIAATAAVAKVGGKTKEETHDFDLALTSDKTDYKVNDLPVFSIKSKEDCHLTLINVDAKGEGTVILPNKFQQDNFLPAGKEAQFPGSKAPFQFRLKDPWHRDGRRHLQCDRQGGGRHQARLQEAGIHRARQLSRLLDEANRGGGRREDRRGQDGRKGKGERPRYSAGRAGIRHLVSHGDQARSQIGAG